MGREVEVMMQVVEGKKILEEDQQDEDTIDLDQAMNP